MNIDSRLIFNIDINQLNNLDDLYETEIDTRISQLDFASRFQFEIPNHPKLEATNESTGVSVNTSAWALACLLQAQRCDKATSLVGM